MAGAALLSQVEGLLEQCVQEYGDNPRVSGLLDETRSVMEEMRSAEGGIPADGTGPDGLPMPEATTAKGGSPLDISTFPQAEDAAREKLSANRKAKTKVEEAEGSKDTPAEEQPEEKAKKRRAKASA